MTSTTQISPAQRGGRIGAVARRAARVSARHPKRTIGLWLLLVVGCLIAGQLTGTKSLTTIQQQPGQSGTAAALMAKADLQDPDVESVLVRASTPARVNAAAAALTRALDHVPVVTSVRGPAQSRSLSTDDGRTVLVQATVKGNLATESTGLETDRVESVQRAVNAVARLYPGVKIQEAGQGSLDRSEGTVITHDLHSAELISLPVTLIILIFAFGALVAAVVPLVLAFSSVAATLGALGVVSQIAPNSDTTAECVVLIGLAVGIDYSLFYIRRERVERRAGRAPLDALEAAASTAGRAVLVSGVTVMLGIAGLLLSGVSGFTSMALGMILVVAIAMLGSLTVLPAMLALLGDRIDKGRLWPRSRRSQSRVWRRLANTVTGHPAAALVSAVCALMALAVPALGLHTANPTDVSDLPSSVATVHAEQLIQRAFPGSPSPAELVVSGQDLGSRGNHQKLIALGDRARTVVDGRGPVTVDVARGGRTALVTVPMAAISDQHQAAAVDRLRSEVGSTAAHIAPGTRVLVGGQAAESVDFSAQMASATPRVLAFVLGLAFLLLLVTLGSPLVALAVVALNLLSVGAAYGVLTAVFQGKWAEHLLGFNSDGTVTSWLPLFMFVILFGLSMDYTVLVLERIREARRRGLPAREAAAEGIAATGGTVTSAAIIMVAVFSIFASLHVLELKQLGVGLAAAVLLDATVVRGVALPAVMAL